MALAGILSSITKPRTWGVTQDDLESPIQRQKFSTFLPWIAWDPETTAYISQDESVGFIWECAPLAFGSLQTINRLEGLLQCPYPENSTLQVLLHADDYIEPFTDAIMSLKERDNPLVKRSGKELVSFLNSGRFGLERMSQIPVRNFRLIVSLKLPKKAMMDDPDSWRAIKSAVEELLRGAHLGPRPMKPPQLLAWLRHIFNDEITEKAARFCYDPEEPINRQIIRAESILTDHGHSLQIGKKHFRCTTPKNFPKYADFLQTNELFGGVWGIRSDPMQIRTPFLFCASYIFQDLKHSLHMKCSLVLQQRAAGSFAPSLQRRQEEYLRTVDALENNAKYVRVVPVLWVWSEDEKETLDSLVRAKGLWEQTGYMMQEDRMILKILFLCSMPLGMYCEGRFLDSLDRDFTLDAPAAARTMPVQADFAGGGQPILTFLGRKGQLITLDFFEKSGGTNYNGFVLAASGTGKSFVANAIAFNYFAQGGKIRIIDIGGSYKKMSMMLGARFLEFNPQTKLVLNPFSTVRYDEDEGEDVGVALRPINAIVAQMAYSSMEGASPSQIETALITEAVKWSWETKGHEAGIDDVYRYLVEFPNHAEGDFANFGQNEDIRKAAHMLALYMKDFISGGPYGRFFNGKANFDISRDEFVVLELGHLKPQVELFRVVMLQVINAVSNDLYLSDRKTKRLIILDEAWQFLGAGGDSTQLQKIIESAYRMARKFLGSIIIISQSLLDINSWGAVGPVIRNNSAFKFYLESADFPEARKQNLINVDDFTMELLMSTKSNRPKYSEIFLESPFGNGILRFVVDDFNYYTYTSDGGEVAEIETLVKQEGLSYEQAIERMVMKYRRKAAA